MSRARTWHCSSEVRCAGRYAPSLRYDIAVAGRRTAHATFFESHATDKTDALSFAVDLTPLVEDEKLDAVEYTMGFIRHFEKRSATATPGSGDPEGRAGRRPSACRSRPRAAALSARPKSDTVRGRDPSQAGRR